MKLLIKREKGSLYVENGRSVNIDERKAFLWIVNNFGGTIISLSPFPEDIKTPDGVWDGKWLEIKTTRGTLGTIDSIVRHAIKQSYKEIVFLDVTKSSESEDGINKVISRRIYRGGGGIVIVVRGGELSAIISKKGAIKLQKGERNDFLMSLLYHN